MAAMTKNAISVTVSDRAKRTKIWDHKGYKSEMNALITQNIRNELLD